MNETKQRLCITCKWHGTEELRLPFIDEPTINHTCEALTSPITEDRIKSSCAYMREAGARCGYLGELWEAKP